MFWVWAGAWVVNMALEGVLRKPEKNPATRFGKKDVDLPTAEQGTPLPRVHGRVMIPQPLLTWWGDFDSHRILDGGREVGYRYFMKAQLKLCSGPASLVEVFVADKSRSFTSRREAGADYDTVVVDTTNVRDIPGEPTVNENVVLFYAGTEEQTGNWYLSQKLGPIPAWPGVCYVILGDNTVTQDDQPWWTTGGRKLLKAGRWYMSDSNMAKPVRFVVEKYSNRLGLVAGHERIGNAENAACAIYDEYTNPRVPYSGAGISPSKLDLVSLRAMGETLHAEGLGVALSFTDESPDDAVEEILRHVDGYKYPDPSTGKIAFGLVRGGYDVNALPTFGKGTIRGLKKDDVGYDRLKTAVRVNWTDPAQDWKSVPAAAQNPVAIEARGGDVDYATVDLRGIVRAQDAQVAVSRLARGVTQPLTMASGYVSRRGWNLRRGSLIKIDWPEEGFSNLVLRVKNVSLGASGDPDIRIEAVEDVFSTDQVVYAQPAASGWSAGDGPGALAAQAVIEDPGGLPGISAILPDSEQARAILIAVRSKTTRQDGFNVLVDEGAGLVDVGSSAAFCPYATLHGDVSVSQDYIVIGDANGLDALRSVTEAEADSGVSLALIGNEFICYRGVQQSIGGTVYVLTGVTRGCLDSVPAFHAGTTPVYFLGNGATSVPILGVAADQTSALTKIRAQPYSSLGVLAPASCQENGATVTGVPRAFRPRCPARVLINDQSYPASIGGVGLRVRWGHRDRTVASRFTRSNATDRQEGGCYYQLVIKGELGTTVKTVDELKDDHYNYPYAEEVLGSGLGRANNTLQILLAAYRYASSGQRVWSQQTFDWTVTRP